MTSREIYEIISNLFIITLNHLDTIKDGKEVAPIVEAADIARWAIRSVCADAGPEALDEALFAEWRTDTLAHVRQILVGTIHDNTISVAPLHLLKTFVDRGTLTPYQAAVWCAEKDPTLARQQLARGFFTHFKNSVTARHPREIRAMPTLRL